MATRQNAVERLVQRLTGGVASSSRVAKHAVILLGSPGLVLISDRLRSCEYPSFSTYRLRPRVGIPTRPDVEVK